MRLVYQNEKLFIPVPNEYQETLKHLLERELEFLIEPFENGFGILIADGHRTLGLYPLDQKFKQMIKLINSEM
jgi:hypothetical protein